MNINMISSLGKDLQNDNMNTAGSLSAPRMATEASGYKLDISGKDKDIKAFGMEELKSFDDIKSKASTRDISLENNALAVMSNSMSAEDFSKVTKDGFSPEDMSVEETVTVVDKIRATLALSGTEIPGYTDNLSSKDIEKITGSESSAIAIESALKENQLPVSKENVESIDEVIKLSEQVSLPSDEAKKYMINNELEPTVNNFYMANHSSSNYDQNNKALYYKDAIGYVGKNPTSLDFEELRPQIEKIVTEAGYELTDEIIEDAKWLIDRNIPVTKENLKGISDINSINFPLKQDVIAKSSAAAIADGSTAKSASLTETDSIITKATNIVNEVNDRISYIEQNPEELKSISKDEISAKRFLEETRLYLTAEASVSLLKKGIEVETKDLQKLVEQLKQAEKETYAPFLMDEKYEGTPVKDILSNNSKDLPEEKIKAFDNELTLKLDLFKKTSKSIEDIKAAPVEFIGQVISEQNDSRVTTLDTVSKAAESVKAGFEKASRSYETLMTAPRSDMGDSIRKAFRNVDDILEDMDIEINRLNEKAVRILGYSGMEINDKNIETAVKAEVAVENVIANMTPAKVLKMIRDGENPLDTDIYELSEKVTEKDFDEENTKYSEFLFKLERNNEISESEKSAFIGMFRLINKIEKSDGKLVGDVIKADEKLTLSNLLTASRNDRQVGTDIKIDNEFGTLEKLITYGESITDQILAGFSNREADRQYEKTRANEIREMVTKEEAVLNALDNIDEAHSPINMAAVNAVINMRGSLFKGLKDRISEEEDNDVRSSYSDIQDSFEDEETVKKAYKSFTEKAENLLKKEVETADNSIDVNSLKLMNKQLSIINKMADQRTYEVPVEIDGKTTSINLKLISDADNAGKVTASFETEATGKVSAEFTLRDGKVSGYIVTENSYYEGLAKEKEQTYRDEFSKVSVDVTSMYYTSKKGLSIKGNYTEKTDRNTAETKMLYSVAKAIIKSVQK